MLSCLRLIVSGDSATALSHLLGAVTRSLVNCSGNNNDCNHNPPGRGLPYRTRKPAGRKRKRLPHSGQSYESVANGENRASVYLAKQAISPRFRIAGKEQAEEKREVQ